MTRLVSGILLASAGATGWLGSSAVAQQSPAATRSISSAEVRPILEALGEEAPRQLAASTGAELDAAWPEWAVRRDAAIRARLEGGAEDSVVNLWLYGTSFTTLRRATARDIATLAGATEAADLLERRLRDLVAGIGDPGTNERLRAAHQLFARQGIDPVTPGGQQEIGRRLAAARRRMLDEFERYDRTLAAAARSGDQAAELAAASTLFRDRGLSLDTSLLPIFGIDQALVALAANGSLVPGRVRRLGIVGPGLDVTNRAEGYDFYPPQTIQPFALVDSLARLGIAKPDALQVATFDLSPAVNQHLTAARDRARAGDAYVLHLALPAEVPWTLPLVGYWDRFGEAIGDEVPAARVPAAAGHVRVRAVRVRPAVVGSITAADLNVILERLPLPLDERFDLVVATNVLVYYNRFEQALAVANIASMLRPGGLLLANTAAFPTPPMKPSGGVISVTYSDRPHDGDHVFWYQRE